MTIRAKLYAAIAMTILGPVVTIGVAFAVLAFVGVPQFVLIAAAVVLLQRGGARPDAEPVAASQ